MIRNKLTEYLESFFGFFGIQEETGFIVVALLGISFALFRLRKWKELEGSDKAITLATIFLLVIAIHLIVKYS